MLLLIAAIVLAVVWRYIEGRRWRGTRSYEEAEYERRMRQWPPHGGLGNYRA